MLPYLLLFLLALFMLLLDKKNVKPNYFWFYVFLIVTAIFSGLRDMIGGYDIYIYSSIYEASANFIFEYKAFEIGFKYYYIALKLINNDRQFMLFITACIISILQFKSLKKLSPLIYFTSFLFFCKFYLLSFIYLRQFLAMGIIWLSIPYIIKRKFLIAIIFIIAAYFFHKTSILFLPILFISKIKFKNINLFLIIVLVLIVGLTPLSNILTKTLAESSENTKAVAYSVFNSEINFLYLIEIIVLSVLLLKFKFDFYKTKTGTLIFNGVFIYVLLNTLSLINGTYIRFGWYYYIFVIIFLTYIPIFIYVQKNKNLFKIIVVLYFSLNFFRLLINWDGGDLMPYKTIYQDFNRPHLYDHYEYRKRKY